MLHGAGPYFNDVCGGNVRRQASRHCCVVRVCLDLIGKCGRDPQWPNPSHSPLSDSDFIPGTSPSPGLTIANH